MPQYFFKENKKEKFKKLILLFAAILFIIIGAFVFIPKTKKSSADISNDLNKEKLEQEKNEDKIIKQEYIIEGGDVFSLINEKIKLSKEENQKVYQLTKDIYDLKNIKVGNKIETIFKNNKFQKFIYNIDNEKFLSVTVDDQNNFISKLEKYNYKTKIVRKEGVVNSSFYASAKNNDIPDKIIMEMANIFAWNVDFGFDIQKGDKFKVVYEERSLDGKKVKPGKIIIAKFINNKTEHYGLYYKDDNGNFDYYNLDGENLRKTFLKSPLKYKYISSNFTYQRWHPKFGGYTPHLAIDYAAPSGTPVAASGKGKVIFVGWKNCIGRTITIRHNSKYTTRYSHLISYAKGIKYGANVSQGQIIGYVGSTGSCSTGPHLEYAMKIYGKAVNPLLQEFGSVNSVSEENKPDFEIKKQALLEMLGEK